MFDNSEMTIIPYYYKYLQKHIIIIRHDISYIDYYHNQ